MGQRLNLEIHLDGEVIANAYYHWSAYTSSSLALTARILENLESVQHDDPVIRAIRLLETTGALITEDQLAAVNKLAPGEEFELAISRSEGLIAITPDGIEGTQRWEEGRVEIHLDTKEVVFDVAHFYDKEEYLNDYDETEENYQNMIILPFEHTNDPIPFSEFETFAEKIISLIADGTYHVRLPDSEDILCFIE